MYLGPDPANLVRIPFPTRIPLAYSCAFALLLCAAQLLESTPLYFSLLTFGFILASTLAFNLAGGFSRASGGYIFFYAVLAVLFGLIYKAILGEPADSNLLAPRTTMLAYLGSASALCVCAFFARRFVPQRPLLAGLSSRIAYGKAAIGCIALSLVIDIWGAVTSINPLDRETSNGSLYTAVRQMDKFLQLGIILGVTYVIRQSHGRRFLNLPLTLVLLYAMVYHGLIGFSKEGLFVPVFAALLAAAAQRYRFSVVQVATFLLGLIVTVQYLVPLIQQGKGLEDTNIGSHFDIALTLASDLDATRRSANIDGVDYDEIDDYMIHYYNQSHGLFDRLQMISIDDALIDATEQGHVFGTYPILFGFMNVIPHALWKSKPLYRLRQHLRPRDPDRPLLPPWRKRRHHRHLLFSHRRRLPRGPLVRRPSARPRSLVCPVLRHGLALRRHPPRALGSGPDRPLRPLRAGRDVAGSHLAAHLRHLHPGGRRGLRRLRPAHRRHPAGRSKSPYAGGDDFVVSLGLRAVLPLVGTIFGCNHREADHTSRRDRPARSGPVRQDKSFELFGPDTLLTQTK